MGKHKCISQLFAVKDIRLYVDSVVISLKSCIVISFIKVVQYYIDPLQALSSLQLCPYQWLVSGLIPQYIMIVSVVNNLL